MCLSTIVELFFTVFIVRSTSASLSLSKIISKIFFTLNNTNVCFYLIHAWINCISDKNSCVLVFYFNDLFSNPHVKEFGNFARTM